MSSPIQELMKKLNYHTNIVLYSSNEKEKESSRDKISVLSDVIKLQFWNICPNPTEINISLEGEAGLRVELLIPWEGD